MIFDPVYMLVMVPGLVLSLWASFKVKSTFNRYSQVRPRSGLSGADAARALLRRSNVDGVQVEEVQGFLSDHYDPGARLLRLSPDVFHGRSLAALGVAAHEAGHALQHATKYAPLGFRSLVVKPASFGSSLGMYAVMGGMLLQLQPLIWLGIVAFSIFVLFTLITLPVEFNASSRAVAALQSAGMIAADEVEGTRKVLNAAALTYVAAAIGAIMNLLYLLWRAGLLGGSRSED
jgi:Zn-dependent membrane protease YugP